MSPPQRGSLQTPSKSHLCLTFSLFPSGLSQSAHFLLFDLIVNSVRMRPLSLGLWGMNRTDECQSQPRLFHLLISGVSLVSAFGHWHWAWPRVGPPSASPPFFSLSFLHAPQGQLMASNACQAELGNSQRGLCCTGPGLCFQAKDRILSWSLGSIPGCRTEALAIPSGQ